MSDANLLEQKPNKYIDIYSAVAIVAVSTSQAYAFVAFPFIVKNTDYTAVARGQGNVSNTIGVEGISGSLPVTRYNKNTNGVRLTITQSDTFTAGRAYFSFGNVRITFA